MDRWDEVLDLLERPDKWSLGGGRAVVWAPSFPRHLCTPGFWDDGFYYHVKIGPLFTVTILDETGRPLEPSLTTRRWRVSHLVSSYDLGADLTMVESRSLSPEDVLTSELEIKSSTPFERKLEVVVWTAQPTRAERPATDFLVTIRPRRDAVVVARQVTGASGAPVMSYCLALGSIRDSDSASVHLSRDPHGLPPNWAFTPFAETFDGHTFPRKSLPTVVGTPGAADCTAWVAMHYHLIVPSGTVRKFTAGIAVAKTGADAARNLEQSLSVHSPADRARRTWRTFFQTVPYFRASNPYIERCYWYRWYVLRLNQVLPADYGPRHACVFEGAASGQTRHALLADAAAQMRELRWCHDRSLAEGTLLNFVEAQGTNGEFPAALGVEFGPSGARGASRADWGRAVRDLFAVSGDKPFLRDVYDALVRYARFVMRSRDREKSGLVDAVDSCETGRDASPAGLPTDDGANRGDGIRLKGVDETVSIYQLFRVLAWMAEMVGIKRDVTRWTRAADDTRQAVRARMFDPGLAMFADVRADSGQRSSVKSAVAFFPFATDIATVEHLDAVRRNLLDPRVFWTEFPVPSLSMDDPDFSATGEWKEVRLARPSNGRSWLRISTLVAEALAEAAVRLDETLRLHAAELISNLVRETFIDRDPTRPASHEYHNPLTGQAPLFLGADDTMNSALADLILKYVAGLRPDPDGNLTVDPLPFGLKKLTVDNVKIRGKDVSLEMIDGRGRLVVGHQVVRFTIGKPVTVNLTQKPAR